MSLAVAFIRCFPLLAVSHREEIRPAISVDKAATPCKGARLEMLVFARYFCLAICAIGCVSCGFPRPADVIGDAESDGQASGGNQASSFPSCSGLQGTCGSAKDSCCTTLDVPGGSYFRSYDFLGDPASGDANHPAKVSSFRLDKYEVTVGRFRAFVQAGMGTQIQPPVVGTGLHPNIPGSGWDLSWNASLIANKDALISALKCDPMFQTWTEIPGANEDRPMNCVTWYEAMAFCIWDGGYLPTEAEWNYAASGGDEQRLYPWSKPANSIIIDGLHASYNYGDGTNCTGDGMPGCALTDLIAVGTKPDGAGRWGQLDLAGNVAEWVIDASGLYVDPCTDCAKLTMTTSRGARGGSFDFDVMLVRAGYRYGGSPTLRTANFGLRCARAM